MLRIATLPDVGKRIRELRIAAGKTQLEIASSVGMRPEALSKLECGRRTDFSLTKLLRLLTALQVEMDFVNRAGRPTLEDLLEERLRNANVGPNSR